jgi:hypothetical protein
MHAATRATSWKSARQQAYDAMTGLLGETKRRDLADLSLAELKAYGDELIADIDTRPPVQIKSFEC